MNGRQYGFRELVLISYPVLPDSDGNVSSPDEQGKQSDQSKGELHVRSGWIERVGFWEAWAVPLTILYGEAIGIHPNRPHDRVSVSLDDNKEMNKRI